MNCEIQRLQALTKEHKQNCLPFDQLEVSNLSPEERNTMRSLLLDIFYKVKAEQSRRLDQQILCVICKDHPRNVLLRPCRHLVVCSHCKNS